MAKLNRRDLLKLGGSAAAAAATLTGAGRDAAAGALLPYPAQALGRAADLREGEPRAFHYPDADSPCVMVKLGRPAPGGVGPEGDIVAHSLLCTHRGCPVAFEASSRTFKCPCHFTIFDAEKRGQMVCGQATEPLPRIVLEHDAESDVLRATAVEGLLYGRSSNLLEGA